MRGQVLYKAVTSFYVVGRSFVARANALTQDDAYCPRDRVSNPDLAVSLL